MSGKKEAWLAVVQCNSAIESAVIAVGKNWHSNDIDTVLISFLMKDELAIDQH